MEEEKNIFYNQIVGYDKINNGKNVKITYLNNDKDYFTDIVPAETFDFDLAEKWTKGNIKSFSDTICMYLLLGFGSACFGWFVNTTPSGLVGKIFCYTIETLYAAFFALAVKSIPSTVVQKRNAWGFMFKKFKSEKMLKKFRKIQKLNEKVKLIDDESMICPVDIPVSCEEMFKNYSLKDLNDIYKNLKRSYKDNKEEIEFKEIFVKPEVEVLELPEEKEEVKEEEKESEENNHILDDIYSVMDKYKYTPDEKQKIITYLMDKK